MSTYRFHPMPNARGGYTTRVALGERITEGALLERSAAAAGLTPKQTSAAVEAFLREVLTAAEDTQWCDDLFGLARFTPLSGGTSPDPEGFRTADDLAAGVSLAFTAEAIRQWRSRLSLASQGLVGKVHPVIYGVVSADEHHLPGYYQGGSVLIRGQRLSFDHTDPEQGVFFRPETGPEVRYSALIDTKPATCMVMVPSGLSGPLYLRVAVRRKGTIRSTHYTTPIPEVAPPPLRGSQA